jgi:hypothetical protein
MPVLSHLPQLFNAEQCQGFCRKFAFLRPNVKVGRVPSENG